MHLLHVSQVSKTEGGAPVLQQVSFSQQPFQKLAIAGATGSGKSTLLKIIAGLLPPDGGGVWFDGHRVKGPQEQLMPGHPGIAYLSQHFELRNHYRVGEFLSMASRLSQIDAGSIYEVCRITHLLQRWTHQVSGGERQRIALARLLVGLPRLLLLDEPFSNLDALHRNLLKQVVNDIGERLHTTCLLVSHEAADTLSWADELLVLQHGKLVQQGPPQHLYQQPANEYVAALLGAYNLIDPALASGFFAHSSAAAPNKKLLVRPEQLVLLPAGNNGLPGIVEAVVYYGNFCVAKVCVAGTNIQVQTTTGSPFVTGDAVTVALLPGAGWHV